LEDQIGKINQAIQKNEKQELEKISGLKEELSKLRGENATLKKEHRNMIIEIGNKEKGIDQLEAEIALMKKSIEEDKDKLVAIERDLEVSRLDRTELELSAERLLSPRKPHSVRFYFKA